MSYFKNTCKPKKKINLAIIGAGWFGCHIATEILKKFLNINLIIFEEQKDIFLGASGYNQNRLHLGFHYPRSKITRDQSKRGFDQFLKKYPKFSKKINNNFYAVDNSKKTKVNFLEFCKIVRKSDLNFKILNKNNYSYANIAGLIKCDERLILVDRAKNFFKKKLKKNLLLNKKVTSIKKERNQYVINDFDLKFDFVINCSWQKLNLKKNWNLIYELCICLLYQKKNQLKKNDECITIMDGPFYTLYKWKSNLHNLYSVKYSRFKKFKNYNQALLAHKKIQLREINNTKKKIEISFQKYYPNFLNNYKFVRTIKSIRTIKKNNKSDDRHCEISFNHRQIDVLSGKIDHICLAEKKITSWLKKKIKY